jgi:hypothetical protein
VLAETNVACPRVDPDTKYTPVTENKEFPLIVIKLSKDPRDGKKLIC